MGDWGHPVSGTRQFGVTVNTSAEGATSYTFYIRGVDRVTDKTTRVMGILTSKTVFKQAHQTWITVMDNIQSFINTKGGSAQSKAPVSQRLNWSDVQTSYTGPNANTEPFPGHVIK